METKGEDANKLLEASKKASKLTMIMWHLLYCEGISCWDSDLQRAQRVLDLSQKVDHVFPPWSKDPTITWPSAIFEVDRGGKGSVRVHLV